MACTPIRHRYSLDQVRAIAAALDAAGVAAIEISHGDGLAGSSITYGAGSHTDWEWIAAAAEVVEHARLTALLLPGIGTVHELRKAWDHGIRSVRIATHCTEADIAEQHIDAARNLGMDVSGFLMMSHMAEPAALSQQARIMEAAGAHCVYVTDSGGRLTMTGVRDRIRAYREVLHESTQDRHPRARELEPQRGKFGRGGRGRRRAGRRCPGRPGRRRWELPYRGIHRSG